MSELKSHDLVDIQDYRGEVYIKSEADKVIAEKDKEIEELKNRIADGDRDFEFADHQNERLLKIVRHHKYKRCLAMADLCFRECQTYCALIEQGEEHFSEMDFYGRWNKIWLILAEKFKEMAK